jgi:hypothetical protein
VTREGAISHVAALTGFAGIVTRYVNLHIISLYEEILELNSPPEIEMYLHKAFRFVFVDICRFCCIAIEHQYYLEETLIPKLNCSVEIVSVGQ